MPASPVFSCDLSKKSSLSRLIGYKSMTQLHLGIKLQERKRKAEGEIAG